MMDIFNVVIVIILCVTGAWTLARSDPSLKRSFGKNIWILLVTFGPAIVSAVLLPWWTFFIALIATMSLSYYFRQLLGDRAPSVGTAVLDHAKRIAKASEHFYTSMSSKSSHSINRADIILDITGYCLYHTFKTLVKAGYSSEDIKKMLQELTKHISFYIERDVSFSDLYMKHFMMTTELLGMESTEEIYKSKMKRHLIKSYSLKPETSVLETTLIEQIDTLIKTESLIKSLR